MSVVTIVSTCRLRDDRPEDREITRVLSELVDSFFATGAEGELHVVDDGSTAAHRSAIQEMAGRHERLRPTFKPENRGTARSKNTALRIFRTSGAEHAFLVDDDIVFRAPGWQAAYREALRRTGFSFLSYFEDRTDTMVERPGTVDMQPRRLHVNGAALKLSPLVMGVLFAYDRAILERVGGFRSFPRKYGHWHTEHNYRCLEAGLSGPMFTDIDGSERYVALNEQFSVYTEDEKREMATENAAVAIRNAERFARIEE